MFFVLRSSCFLAVFLPVQLLHMLKQRNKRREDLCEALRSSTGAQQGYDRQNMEQVGGRGTLFFPLSL